MRIYIDEIETGRLTKKQEGKIVLGRDAPEIVAIVLTQEQATERQERVARLLAYSLGTIFTLLLAGLSAAIVFTDDATLPKPFLLAFAAAVGAFCLWLVTFMLRRMRRKWRDRMAQRFDGAPAPGARITASNEGLRWGAHAAPWSALTIEGLWLAVRSDPDGPSDYVVDRLLLVGDGRNLLLDATMLDEGRRLVDKAYRSLRASVQGEVAA